MCSIKKYGQEVAEIAAKTALSAIPIGGTLITCVWDSVKANAAKKRLDEWKEMLEARLSKVEISLDEIGNNELFASCIMKATDAALRTAQAEKRNYLADAVLNSVTLNIGEDIAMIFLDIIERYTVLHIKILHFFNNPLAFNDIKPSKYYMGSPMEPLRDALPELRGQDEIINKAVKDLYSDGLLNTENLGGMMSGNGMVARRTTGLGQEFISFVTTK